MNTENRYASFGVIYALHFSGVGIFLTFFSPYLKDLGLSGADVGMILSLPSLARIVSPLFWGYFADRLNDSVFVLRLVIFLSLLCTSTFFFVEDFWSIALVLFIYALIKTAVPSLTDAVCMNLVKRTGKDYSTIRIWGSIGFVVSALLTGFVMDRITGSAQLAFGAICALYVGCLIASMFLARETVNTSSVNLRLIGSLLKNGRLKVLFIASGIHWASTMPYHGFLPIHVKELGLTASIAGICFAFAGFTEILMMSRSRFILGRWSARQLFVFSVAISGFRWLMTAFLSDPYLLIAVQAIHAFTFAGFYIAAIEVLLQEIPDSLRATGQGLFFSAAFGFGGGIGVLLTGFVYGEFGGSGSFVFGALLSLLATVIAKRL